MMHEDALSALLASAFSADELLFGEPMAAHTTFQIGGPVDCLVVPADADGVARALTLAHEEGVPCHVLGCGSNLLVADEGLRGIAVLIGERMAKVSVDGCLLHAQAGATNEQVAQAALEAGLSGYEFASGIPGSIGGAAIMNAGAYDGEFRDVAIEVECLTSDGRQVRVSASEADWGYRHSMMMDAGMVVLSATLRLEPGDRQAIAAKMADLAQRRADKQPLELPSAGSTFKRPEGHYAGKLIQDAGMRGHSVGGAQVSTKHCGFVVNAGGATATDVRRVIRDVQDAVRAQFDVELQPEIRMWGF